MRFLDHQQNEPFKACYHLGLGLGMAGALLYNILAYRKRKGQHLAMNIIVYAAGVAIEGLQVKRHWDDM